MSLQPAARHHLVQAHKGERLEESKAALFASPIASNVQRSRSLLQYWIFSGGKG